ncbi:CDP-glycerol glycerophosphotransferase family protein [Vibrio sp. SS-MA-C1-2]|uniref:CDP-glycerol glycerophosphotransferase family protein n=1 Tax=Vibrio sp. SS-MA-C1-2 TaxID=2908646 RepID=UPI001F1BD408|nr:CDP-glycerol glycerophosphotransferase family protein [Vibrio sp. SS-MA-C1-2]UJF18232.1 CDP-glycerol glycerophosphotransferase family protein [Vibrio sp. SS-MA-C1-2]
MSQKSKRYLMYIAQNYSYAILRPLQKVILARGDEVCWFLEGKEVSTNHLEDSEIHLKSIKDVRRWKPDAVFVPGNMVPSFIPGIKVEVFHGFNSNKRGPMEHFRIRGCFDLYCTQGPNTTETFQNLADEYKYFQVKETGWPTLDPLFTVTEDNPYIDTEDKRSTVLMCSTFSKNLTCAPILFDKIKELSTNGKYRWLIQFHPKMPVEIVEKYKSLQNENLTFIETDNVIPLLQAADVMLCDTSSILLMFMLQRKPVVTFNNQAPNHTLINISDVNELEDALQNALSRPENLMAAINKFCQELHPYRDGMSSERVLSETDNIIELSTVGETRKPINLIRNLKLFIKL